MVWFSVVSQHLLGGIEENHGKPQDRMSVARDHIQSFLNTKQECCLLNRGVWVVVGNKA
jgi:hypothetical protein